MISNYFIIASASIFVGIIGIQLVTYWFLFLIAFLLGFVIHLIIHKSQWLTTSQQKRTIKTSFNKGKLVTHIDDSDVDSPVRANDRAPLTGIPVIDETLYETVDLFVRDYIEIWYKTQLSTDESFIHDVKNGIYITIRHLAERLREIDWLDFCTGTVVDSFATHVRLYRNAKGRMRAENSTDIRAYFFDLEAEYERGICRDEVCMDRDKEKEFLRDIVEVLLYILIPANEFRCVPARLLIREVVVNIGLVPFIDMYTDPDAINQLIIKMCQQIPLTIENFLLVARTTDSRAELSALAERIDVEIGRWRSKDTGGENDADIRATLNSYQYLKRLLADRLEKQAQTMTYDDDELLQKVPYHELPLTEILNNCNGLDYFLKFLQTLDAVGYANFYLNAEAFRCAGLSFQQQQPDGNTTPEQIHANLEMLRNMANDLVEQYFLPTGTFKLQMDENLVEKTLKNLRAESIDETILDELQSKVFELLSSDKYYGQFKTTPQYLKVLSEIDPNDSLNDNSDAVSVSSNNSNEIAGDSIEQQSQPLAPTNSLSSANSTTSVLSDILDNIHQYSITTEINDSGVCCEKGEKYAIYVISVCCKSLYPNGPNEQKREWITYRRFSEFNDLDITIRKRYPELRQYLHLPTKSLINNISLDVRLKRQKELNNYLSVKSQKKTLIYL